MRFAVDVATFRERSDFTPCGVLILRDDVVTLVT